MDYNVVQYGIYCLRSLTLSEFELYCIPFLSNAIDNAHAYFNISHINNVNNSNWTLYFLDYLKEQGVLANHIRIYVYNKNVYAQQIDCEKFVSKGYHTISPFEDENELEYMMKENSTHFLSIPITSTI